MADRIHLGDTVGAEEIEQRPQHHLDALDDRLTVAATLRGFDGTLEVVHDRQQVAQEVLALNPDAIFALLANPLARVLRIGQYAQILVL